MGRNQRRVYLKSGGLLSATYYATTSQTMVRSSTLGSVLQTTASYHRHTLQGIEVLGLRLVKNSTSQQGTGTTCCR